MSLIRIEMSWTISLIGRLTKLINDDKLFAYFNALYFKTSLFNVLEDKILKDFVGFRRFLIQFWALKLNEIQFKTKEKSRN